jgi:hypothetical protein
MKKLSLDTVAVSVLLMLVFVVCGTAEARHRSSVGIWVGPGWVDPYPYYSYPYYPYYREPPIIVQQPEVYVQPAPAPAPTQQPSYWYFCKEPQGYYPYVNKCPSGWMKVVPTPPGQSVSPPIP